MITLSLRAWRDQPGLYRPVFLLCMAVAVLCLGLGIARPAPLGLAVVLVGLYSFPWSFAVAHLAIHDKGV